MIDLGPEGGEGGGELLAEGTPEDICAHPSSETGKVLARVLRTCGRAPAVAKKAPAVAVAAESGAAARPAKEGAAKRVKAVAVDAADPKPAKIVRPRKTAAASAAPIDARSDGEATAAGDTNPAEGAPTGGRSAPRKRKVAT